MNIENIQPEEIKEDLLATDYDEIKAIEMEGYALGVRKARNTLFVVAAILLFGEIVGLARSGVSLNEIPWLVWLILIIEVGSFVALAFLTKVKPFLCILIGLVLFIALWLYTIAENGLKGAFGGIVIKVIVIAYLFNSLKDARALEEAKKEIL
jgi:hypothetical protein